MLIIKKITKAIKKPEIIKNFIKYKILAIFAKKTLNDGERYDPNIFKKINFSDPSQSVRYDFAKEFIDADDEVLDIACGTGYGSSMLAEKCKFVTGVDISTQAIKYANKNYKKNNTIFIISDLFETKKVADVVISFETVEHVQKPLSIILEKLISLAKKRILISVPYLETNNHNKHHFHFQISEKSFEFLKEKNVKFIYQLSDKKIVLDKPENKNITNLLISIQKK